MTNGIIHSRLNSLEYGDLREKLQQPINNARNIVVHQTLSERFVAAFSQQVRSNSAYTLPPGSAVSYFNLKLFPKSGLHSEA